MAENEREMLEWDLVGALIPIDVNEHMDARSLAAQIATRLLSLGYMKRPEAGTKSMEAGLALIRAVATPEEIIDIDKAAESLASTAHALRRQHAAEMLHGRLWEEMAPYRPQLCGERLNAIKDECMAWCMQMVDDLYAIDSYEGVSPATCANDAGTVLPSVRPGQASESEARGDTELPPEDQTGPTDPVERALWHLNVYIDIGHHDGPFSEEDPEGSTTVAVRHMREIRTGIEMLNARLAAYE